jgi:hypothetical protein
MIAGHPAVSHFVWQIPDVLQPTNQPIPGRTIL